MLLKWLVRAGWGRRQAGQQSTGLWRGTRVLNSSRLSGLSLSVAFVPARSPWTMHAGLPKPCFSPSVPLWPFVFCVAGPKDFRFRNENDLCNLRRSPSLLNADVDIVILAVVGIWALSSRHLFQFNRAACVTLWKMTTKMNRIGRVCGSPFGINIFFLFHATPGMTFT